MKERVFAAVREMKREQWLICGLAGLLLLVIAAPVKQKEQKKTQEKTTVSQTQEQTDDQIRQSYEKQLESVLSQVEGVGAVQVAVAMESTGTITSGIFPGIKISRQMNKSRTSTS